MQLYIGFIISVTYHWRRTCSGISWWQWNIKRLWNFGLHMLYY